MYNVPLNPPPPAGSDFQSYNWQDWYRQVYSSTKAINLFSDAPPANGQIPIGDGSRFVTANVTPSSSIAVTNGAGSLSFALTNTGVTAGTYGSSTTIPVVTFDAQGRASAVVSTPLAVLNIPVVATTLTHSGYEADQSYQYVVGVNAGSYTLTNNSSTLILDPAGALSTYTLVMPPGPVDGQRAYVTVSVPITTLTVNANTGQSIKNPPPSINTGTGFTALSGFGYIYRASNTTWYRLY